MKTTKQLLAELARRYPRSDGRPASDYGLAKLLNVSTPTLSRYQKHGRTFDDDVALRVAELLNLEPLKVLAAMQAERAKNAEVRKVWAAAAATLAALAITASWFDFADQAPAGSANAVYYVKSAAVAFFLAAAVLAGVLWNRYRQ